MVWFVVCLYAVIEIEYFCKNKNINDKNYHANTREFEVMNPTVAIKNKDGRFAFMVGSLTVIDPVSDEEFGVHSD